MTIDLRTATSGDIEAIAALHAESWRRNYRGIYPFEYLDKEVAEDRLAVWRTRLSSPPPNQHVVLAELDSQVSAFICVYADDDPEWGSLIDNLHVATDLKRTGIGTLLMREGARWLQAHYPRSPVYLWVLEANASARAFYEKLGGHHTGAVPQPVPGGGFAMSCRQTWPDPETLLKAAEAATTDSKGY
jgi:ribosomal protein S18 acetylase RimI-like enzyme